MHAEEQKEEVKEEEKDELFDRIRDDILSAKSLDSGSESEREEPKVQEPIENIQLG